MKPLRPNQQKAIAETWAYIARQIRRMLIVSPTGGGKTRIMAELAALAVEQNWAVSIYCNRSYLLQQITRTLEAHDVEHGVRARGYRDRRELPVQVSSMQTEQARHLRRAEHKRWNLHKARLVMVDEGHLHTGRDSQKIIQRHIEAGAQIIYLSATPFDLGKYVDVIIQAGTTSELRGYDPPALVRAVHFGPDEPDFKQLKRLAKAREITAENSSASEPEARKLMKPTTIWGRVVEWYDKINPERRPTILFAPGVGESIWFAEKFSKLGIRAAHIDGENCWLDGVLTPTDATIRSVIEQGSKDGSIPVVCNRFVLREGIDWPWVSHGIFATVFDSMQSYIQAGGRMLRWCEGKLVATIQDHGGHWWRFGSLNEDREWNLDTTEASVVGIRAERLRAKYTFDGVPATRDRIVQIAMEQGMGTDDGLPPMFAAAVAWLRDRGHVITGVKEPRTCPNCRRILFSKVCECGFEIKASSPTRFVVQADGNLRELIGDIFQPKRVKRTPNTLRLWTSCYFRARNSRKGMTFAQAAGYFALKNFYHPPRDMPYMPKYEQDWYKLVRDVPRERLIGGNDSTGG